MCVRTHVRLCVWSMHGFHHQLVARLSDSLTVTHSGSCHPLSKTTEGVCDRDGCVWSPGNLGQMDIQELQTSTFNPNESMRMTLRNTLTQRETESGRAVPHLSACVAELGLSASSLTFAPGTCSLHSAKLPSKASDFETFGFREK